MQQIFRLTFASPRTKRKLSASTLCLSCEKGNLWPPRIDIHRCPRLPLPHCLPNSYVPASTHDLGRSSRTNEDTHEGGVLCAAAARPCRGGEGLPAFAPTPAADLVVRAHAVDLTRAIVLAPCSPTSPPALPRYCKTMLALQGHCKERRATE